MDEDIRTVWCGNLSDKVTEELLYELFLQGGPVQRVSIPKDRNGKQRTYGFVTYKHLSSVGYALSLFDGTVLFNRPLSMSTRNNAVLPQTESPQHQPPNLCHMLQLGQQMLLGANMPQMSVDPLAMNMLPNSFPYSKQDVHSGKNDRASRRMHPYHRESSKNDNDNHHHRDHRSRNNHNHRSNDYSKHNYKSSRRNYH